jgi:SAM-dependent methyltransferase
MIESPTSLEKLCVAYGADAWHWRNHIRRPLYQSLTTLAVERLARPSDHIVEVGCGIGDILERVYEAGFRRLTGIERDEAVWNVARERLAGTPIALLRQDYPCTLPKPPDLLVTVNCVYWEADDGRKQYLESIRNWMNHCGEPSRGFLVELVHESYRQMTHSQWLGDPSEFPSSCRVSQQDVVACFPEHEVYAVASSELGRIPKALYCIARSLEPHRLDGLMERVCAR